MDHHELTKEYFWLRNAVQSIIDSEYLKAIIDPSSLVLPLGVDPVTGRMQLVRYYGPGGDEAGRLFEIFLGEAYNGNTEQVPAHERPARQGDQASGDSSHTEAEPTSGVRTAGGDATREPA